jgi:hypothetical protein
MMGVRFPHLSEIGMVFTGLYSRLTYYHCGYLMIVVVEGWRLQRAYTIVQ